MHIPGHRLEHISIAESNRYIVIGKLLSFTE